MHQVKSYQSRQTGLRIVGAYTWLIGVLNTVGGASSDSRFYAVDDIVVRAVGVAFIVLGLGLVLKNRWPVLPLTIVYGLALIEVLATTAPGQLPAMAAGALLFFGLPLLFLLRALRQENPS